MKQKIVYLLMHSLRTGALWGPLCGLITYLQITLRLHLRRLRPHILWLTVDVFSSIPPPKMHETRRLLEAATALSLLLRNASIPHAFYGSFLTAVLATSPFSDASIFPSYLPSNFNIFLASH